MLILSEETRFQAEVPTISIFKGRYILWRESFHTNPGRLGLIILAGAKVVFGPIRITDSYKGLISVGAGLPELSRDGLNLLIKFRPIKNPMNDVILLDYHIPFFNPDNPWTELDIPLHEVIGQEGSFVLECTPGKENDPTADHLAVYEFVISPKESFRLNRARAFMSRRMANERKFFTQVYEHSMYEETSHPDNSDVRENSESSAPAAHQTPLFPVSVYGHVMALLNAKLDTQPPNFFERMKNKVVYQKNAGTGTKKKIKILSLCSGAARIETEFIRQLPPESVDLTLSDINPILLDRARKKLERYCKVQILQSDINTINTGEIDNKKFDIIMCVSALHHIVELEKVMHFVSLNLADEGEFWVIGEYVGKNGNRLWPETYEIANGFFQRLPEKYRINKTSSASARTDNALPNNDCSLNVFEGIRSEDIENCLAQYFTPLSVHKYCCFLWRLFDLAYCDNYDLRSPEDLKIIQDAIELELAHYYSGGKPSTLNGIYTKKLC